MEENDGRKIFGRKAEAAQGYCFFFLKENESYKLNNSPHLVATLLENAGPWFAQLTSGDPGFP